MASEASAALAPERGRSRIPAVGGDRDWLTVMASVTALESAWWALLWSRGLAPFPFVGTYLGLALAGLACALLLDALFKLRGGQSRWTSLLPATLMVSLGASLFLPLKYAIPQVVPFWLDPPLARIERSLFGTDPWLVLDHLLGWAAVPIDRLYGLWLPTQTLILFVVMIQAPSKAKSRALIAYVLAWFVLGVVAATLFSSAGPIFYDRLTGGSDFGLLKDTLRSRGAWIALAESDAMWASLATGRPGIVAGISALPSIHVAISLWIYLVARSMAPRAAPVALAYFAFIFIGSVELGWHYVTDGVAGAVGMAAIWWRSRTALRDQEGAIA